MSSIDTNNTPTSSHLSNLNPNVPSREDQLTARVLSGLDNIVRAALVDPQILNSDPNKRVVIANVLIPGSNDRGEVLFDVDTVQSHIQRASTAAPIASKQTMIDEVTRKALRSLLQTRVGPAGSPGSPALGFVEAFNQLGKKQALGNLGVFFLKNLVAEVVSQDRE